MNRLKRVWLLATTYWIVLAALCCLVYPITVFDSISRYAPMAEAFARGDWWMAYHPRFGVLFTTLAGVVASVTGLNGDCACQVVSVGFLAFSAVPVWALVRRVFGDERVASVAAVLVLIATEYFMLAEDGLRDTVRIFGLAACVLSFFSGRSWTLALGLFCLVTVRTDLLLISGAILAAWWASVLFSRRTRWSSAEVFQQPAANSQRAAEPKALALALPTACWTLGVALMCFMTHAYTGCWTPGAQFVGFYLKLTGGAQ